MNIHWQRRIIIAFLIVSTIAEVVGVILAESVELKRFLGSLVLLNSVLLLSIFLAFLFYRDEWKRDDWKKQKF